MADLTAKYVSELGCNNVLLTGTQYTMECGYYTNKLEAFGAKVTIPDIEDRILIQSMQQSIAKGKSTQGFDVAFKDIIAKYPMCDAIITACTELPLIITPKITTLTIIDPLKIQCAAAFEYAVAHPSVGNKVFLG
jgi:aspartate racemase